MEPCCRSVAIEIQMSHPVTNKNEVSEEPFEKFFHRVQAIIPQTEFFYSDLNGSSKPYFCLMASLDFIIDKELNFKVKSSMLRLDHVLKTCETAPMLEIPE